MYKSNWNIPPSQQIQSPILKSRPFTLIYFPFIKENLINSILLLLRKIIRTNIRVFRTLSYSMARLLATRTIRNSRRILSSIFLIFSTLMLKRFTTRCILNSTSTTKIHNSIKNSPMSSTRPVIVFSLFEVFHTKLASFLFF